MNSARIVRIVVLDRETLSEASLRPPAFAHELVVFPHTAPDEVAARIRDADVVVTNKVAVRRAALATAERLKLIAVAATGTDIVDVGYCVERQIAVANVRGYAVNTVPEHTFALILALRRSIVAYRESVARGRWQAAASFCYFDHPIHDLAGATLGIFGGGVLGRRVADIARGFRMNVLFSARKGDVAGEMTHTPFDEVLRRSDILTLHLPLTDATRSMIADREFALMERRPLMINTARGGLVDEAALVRALNSGRISGAAFDVVTAEPPPPDHPFMKLLDRPDFILTPHVAWASAEAIQALADQVIDNIEAFWNGTPRNLVT